MRIISLFICAFILSSGSVKAQCVNGVTGNKASALPCIMQGTPFNGFIQLTYPDSIVFGNNTYYIDSVKIDSVNRMPSGITCTINPQSGVIHRGSSACIQFSGTSNAAPGVYGFWYAKHVYSHPGTLPLFVEGNDDSLTVCSSLSVTDLNPDLNKVMSIYPNPSTGHFNVDVNIADNITGQIMITDVSGRKIFSQQLDVTGPYTTVIDLSIFAKGLYAVELNTAGGFASKKISIE